MAVDIPKGTEAPESQPKAVVPKCSCSGMAGNCGAEGNSCGWGFPEHGVPERGVLSWGQSCLQGVGGCKQERILVLLFSFIYIPLVQPWSREALSPVASQPGYESCLYRLSHVQLVTQTLCVYSSGERERG